MENPSTTIELSYKPVDFFYYNSNLTPSTTDCANLILSPDLIHCHPKSDSWIDISFNCYQKELCENRNLANKIQLSQSENLETETREDDMNTIYEHSRLKTMNLSGGIVIMTILLYFL